MKQIAGGVCAATGFSASGVHCGIRKNKTKRDLALIYSSVPASAAAVYTTNLVKGAPLVVTKQHLADGTVEGTNVCEPAELPIESIRRDEVPGIHSIIYNSEADCITITHDAHSRKGFALGAVLAAEFTKEHEGLLTIGDMFKF